jgi:hypothetical protein
LVAGVIVVADVIAIAPALVATQSKPGELLPTFWDTAIQLPCRLSVDSGNGLATAQLSSAGPDRAGC